MTQKLFEILARRSQSLWLVLDYQHQTIHFCNDQEEAEETEDLLQVDNERLVFEVRPVSNKIKLHSHEKSWDEYNHLPEIYNRLPVEILEEMGIVAKGGVA